ncbi:MAG TPA: GDSL-type esterase/lipase family protein [Actinomycetota bacterium]|nr:GDSL-type esterase/lipase family protein [Actinomycetota bacterium]
MRNRLIVIIVVAALAGGAAALIAMRDGTRDAAVGEKVVLAFGDSVAAGQGLGPALGYPNNDQAYPARLGALLGWRSMNFAVSSACAASADDPGAHPDTPGTCQASVLRDQIPHAAETFKGSPRVVVLTVGANDIRYADCGLQVIVPELFDDKCDDATLDRRLVALEANLGRVLDRLRRGYPGSVIVLTSYYNPMPAPVRDGEEACPIYEPLAALKSPVTLVSERALRAATADLQAQVHVRFREGVTRLNESIARAAIAGDAIVAPADFTGHDLCRSETGGGQAWVYGPDYDIRFRLKGAASLLGARKTWRGTLPSRCPSPSPAEPPEHSTGEVERRVGVGTVIYSARVNVNCMPHPTAEGQQALAAAVLAALPEPVR